LPACRKVCEQVADFLGGESLELAFGHHGDGRGFDLLDVLAGKDDPLVGGLDGDRAVILLADDTGDKASVRGGDVSEGVFAGDGGAGVEDVFEDVVGIGTVGAGQVGSDVAAAIEEFVALVAGVFEDKSASCRVAGWVLVSGQEILVLRDQRTFLIRGRPDGALDGLQTRADLLVAQSQQLPGDRGVQIAARD